MKVLMVSKALVVAAYRKKLTELGRLGVEVTAVVPPEWREGGGSIQLEPDYSEGYRLTVAPIHWNGHFHLHYYPKLSELIGTSRPDIVHIDEEPYNLATYLGVSAARRAGAPTLFFSWQNIVRRYPPPFAQMERSVYRSAAHALAGSDEVASVLRKKGYAKPISVVPQFGVDPEIYRPGEGRDGPFTIGFLNRLIPAKAPILTLDAFEMLPRDSKLVVVGDGPLRASFEEEIYLRGLAERVDLQNRLASARVPELLRTLDVVVLPSLTTSRWKEQFGRILIEAMASGVPVVGSASGEIPVVVGDAGLIVPEGDAAALAAALKRLYDDPQLRAQLGQRGRQRALQYFTHERIARLTYEAYAQVLQGASS